ncbi:MAG TPA: DUF2298 domain-containing protein, partial [bacterium]
GNMDYWHRAIQSYFIGDLRVPYYNTPTNPGSITGFSAFFGFLLSPLQHSWDYFQASRIIPVPPTDKMINEFPAFSFFLSDLHPHVMAIPFILLAMALAFNLLKATSPGLNVFGGRRPWQLLQWILLAVVFGGLAFLNSWDFPSLMFLLGLCLFLQQWWANEPKFGVWFKSVATIGIPIVIGAFVLYSPFYLRFQSQAQGLGFVGGDRTDLYYLFVIFGLFFVVMVPALVGKAFPSKSEKSQRSRGKRSEELECTVCGKAGVGKRFCGFCGGELAPPVNSEITPLPDDQSRAFLTKIGSWFSSESNPLQGWIVFGAIMAALFLLNFSPLKLSTALLALLFVLFCVVSLSVKTESKEMVFSTLLVMIAFLLIFACEVI